MPDLLQNLRYAGRLLLRSPGFTLVAVMTLGIGIGANVTIFSMVNALLIRPLAAPHSEQLVRLYETNQKPYSHGSVSAPNFLDWERRNTVFTGLSGFVFRGVAVQGRSGSEGIRGVAVSANYFQLLGLKPLFGRVFSDGEDRAGHDHVVILRERVCRRLFGTDGLIASPIQLNNESYTVIGVMPDTAAFPDEKTEAWIPLTFSKDQLEARDNHWFGVVGRLREGVSLVQAQQALSTISGALAHEYPDQQTARGIEVVSLHQDIVGDTRPALLLLQGTVACMLFIASINVANLLLSRVTTRRQEMATRAALGASRWQLTRQLLIEGIALAGVGGMVGLLLAVWGAELLSWLAASYLPRLSEVRIDTEVLAFSVLLSFVVGIVCGLAPVHALSGKRGNDLQSVLRGHALSSTRGSGRSRQVMVVVEIASAVIILSCAGLLLRSFLQLQMVHPGVLEPERILTATIRLPPARYSTGHSVAAFYQSVQARADRIPGVKFAGAINDLPFEGDHDATTFQIEGRPSLQSAERPVAETQVVSGDYFAAAGIPLLAGRLLDDRDTADEPRAILINQKFVLRFWKDAREAIGNRINDGATVATIVGVVGDVRQFGLGKPAEPEIYFPVRQAQDATDVGENAARRMVLVVRAGAGFNPSSLVEPLRQAVAEVDAGLPLYRVRPWSTVIADSIGDRRLNLGLVGSFALVALFLAALGLYGLVSHGVIQRTREIGVRMSLGARQTDVVRLVLWEGSRLAILGIGIGLTGALGFTRVLQGLLFEVSPTDPIALAGVVLLLVGVTLLANYLPARRAAAVDPIRALRE